MVLVRHKSPEIGRALAMNRILCIGKAIFDDEASLLMCTVFPDWHLAPVAGGEPKPRFLFTLRPDRPMLVRLRRR